MNLKVLQYIMGYVNIVMMLNYYVYVIFDFVMVEMKCLNKEK